MGVAWLFWVGVVMQWDGQISKHISKRDGCCMAVGMGVAGHWDGNVNPNTIISSGFIAAWLWVRAL
jgi:hypothetical protein